MATPKKPPFPPDSSTMDSDSPDSGDSDSPDSGDAAKKGKATARAKNPLARGHSRRTGACRGRAAKRLCGCSTTVCR